MDLTAFTAMLLRRGWIPVALALVGAAAGVLVAATQAPLFEATTRLAVAPARPVDFGQTQATKELMQSMVADLQTYDMADAVAARLGEDWLADRGMDAGGMRFMLDSGRMGFGSDINIYELQVKARAGDPAVAVQVSEKWAETFADRRDKANLALDRDDRIAAVIRDEPVPRQVAPRRKLWAVLGAVAGFGAGVVVMLALELVESAVVTTARSAERATGAPVLGAVPESPGAALGRGLVRRGVADALVAARWHVAGAWPIALCAVVGAAAAFAFSQAQPTTFRARTRIALEPATSSNWGNTQAIRETMRGYTEDIRTRRMARVVNERLELDLPADALLDKLNVAEQTGVYELVVDVFDRDPDVAGAISRTWSEVFIEEHRAADEARDQRDRILVRLRDATRAAPWSPRTGVATLAGAALGALVGLVAVLLRAAARAGLVRNADDARRASGAPVLGAIPSAATEGAAR